MAVEESERDAPATVWGETPAATLGLPLRRTAEAMGFEARAVAGGAFGEFDVFHALDGAVGVHFRFQHGIEAGGVEMLAAFRDAAVAAAFRLAPAVGRVE